jgi:hypothetical protein
MISHEKSTKNRISGRTLMNHLRVRNDALARPEAGRLGHEWAPAAQPKTSRVLFLDLPKFATVKNLV